MRCPNCHHDDIPAAAESCPRCLTALSPMPEYPELIFPPPRLTSAPTPPRTPPAPPHPSAKRLLDTLVWITIPPGEFLFGRRNVSGYLDSYRIMKYPVTVGQFWFFSLTAGYPMPTPPPWGWQDAHPMVNASWDDAMAFAAWLGLGLPTEEEWEKAARGPNGLRYPWGSQWDPKLLRCSARGWGGAGSTAPIGCYPAGASPYGVLDMAGNTWEWCDAWYDRFHRTRVMRGGSWFSGSPEVFYATNRHYNVPTARDTDYGLRCVWRLDG